MTNLAIWKASSKTADKTKANAAATAGGFSGEIRPCGPAFADQQLDVSGKVAMPHRGFFGSFGSFFRFFPAAAFPHEGGL